MPAGGTVGGYVSTILCCSEIVPSTAVVWVGDPYLHCRWAATEGCQGNPPPHLPFAMETARVTEPGAPPRASETWRPHHKTMFKVHPFSSTRGFPHLLSLVCPLLSPMPGTRHVSTTLTFEE